MAKIKDAIETAVAYLTAHPEEARYTDSHASATLKEGLRCTIVGPKGESIVTDMPSGVGGGEAGPSPGWLFRAALAGCNASLIAMEVAREGVTLKRLEVRVDSESDDRGILAIEESVPAGPLSIRVQIRIEGSAAPERLREIVGRAVAHCPVHEAAGRAVPVAVIVEVG